MSSSPVPIVQAQHEEEETDVRTNHRQSVDWYAGLAADNQKKRAVMLPPTVDELEEEVASVPEIQIHKASTETVESTDDPLYDVDRSKGTLYQRLLIKGICADFKIVEFRVRSLYAYEGQRSEDLCKSLSCDLIDEG